MVDQSIIGLLLEGITVSAVTGGIAGNFATDWCHSAIRKVLPKHNHDLERAVAEAFRHATENLKDDSNQAKEIQNACSILNDNTTTLLPIPNPESPDILAGLTPKKIPTQDSEKKFPDNMVDAVLFGYPYTLPEVLKTLLANEFPDQTEEFQVTLAELLAEKMARAFEEIIKEKQFAPAWIAFVRELLWEIHGLLIEQSEKMNSLDSRMKQIGFAQRRGFNNLRGCTEIR